MHLGKTNKTNAHIMNYPYFEENDLLGETIIQDNQPAYCLCRYVCRTI